MFWTICLAALAAGLAAGVVVTGVESLKVLPLILEAERYEGAAAMVAAASVPGDDLGRLSLTLLANSLAGIGFAMVLTAGASLSGHTGWQRGLVWGLAGWAVFNLVPAFGLPPELPGMAAAELGARQVWWVAAAAATALGLSLVVLHPKALLKGLGALVIVVPHVVGAPHAETLQSSALPAELAATFVGASLFASLLFWLVVGGVSGYVFRRMSSA